MTDEQQPDVRWAPLEPKPRNRGRVWLIVGLAVAALVIVGVLLFFLLPRGGAPAPEQSATPSPSASATSTPSPEPSDSPEPTMTPITEPPVSDPTLEAFRGQVQGWLSDAERGLDLAAQAGGQDAVSVVDTLQLDAQRLADAQPPANIDQKWRDGVSTYSTTLDDLRTAASAGGSLDSALSAARSALAGLETTVGM